MKAWIATGLIACSLAGYGQTKIEKNIPVRAGQKLELNMEYPELIQLRTWDGKDVVIKGDVSINNGEHDSAFDLHITNADKVITVTSRLKDKDKIPKRLMIKKGDHEYHFKAADTRDPEVQKFLKENGGEYTYMSNGIIQEIKLEVLVPKDMECYIEAKFGIVEVVGFQAPLTVNAIHGGVDATISPTVIGELTARTRFGEILSNLDIKFDGPGMPDPRPDARGDNWTEVHARTGSGPRYALESKFGKVYLRKPR